MDGYLSFKLKQLRKQAENRLHNDSSNTNYMVLTDHAIYELELHQTELEVQHEELERTNEELQTLYQEYWDLYEFAPCGYVILDKNGLISRINKVGIKLLGLAQACLTYPGFAKLISPEHQHCLYAGLHEARKTGKAQSLEIKSLYTKLWVHLDIKASFNSQGQVKQWLIAITDVTAEKEADQSLTQTARSQLLEEKAKREKLVNSIASCLDQNLELEGIIEQAATQALEAFPVSRVVLAACDNHRETFDLMCVGKVNASEYDIAFSDAHVDYWQAQHQFHTHPMLAIDDTAATETSISLLADEGEARSVLAAGIWFQNTLQGIISLQVSSQPYHWQKSEQQLLQQITNQLAIALQQARVYEALKAKLSEIGN
jgi:PAS domain S-box-containing protein